MCGDMNDPMYLQSFLLTTLHHHLEGDEKVYETLESVTLFILIHV